MDLISLQGILNIFATTNHINYVKAAQVLMYNSSLGDKRNL